MKFWGTGRTATTHVLVETLAIRMGRLPMLKFKSGQCHGNNERRLVDIRGYPKECRSPELTAKYTITFIMGKGNILVRVLLPRNCEKAMGILAGSADRAHERQYKRYFNIDLTAKLAEETQSARSTTSMRRKLWACFPL